MVDEVGADPEAELFRFYAQGTQGRWLQPPLLLNGLPWFYEFRRTQSNFSFGLNPIPALFVAALEALVGEVNR